MNDQRPLYHFQPRTNWMNDPNGLIHWRGQYHLFYQYNPHGAHHGAIHWGHATSADLVQWTHLPVALAPTPGGPDEDGCWSGCAVDNDGVPTLIYTGVRRDPVDHGAYCQTQCLATSDDELRTWTKHPDNPVIARPPDGVAVVGFRDPCAWKDGATWYCVIGSGIAGRGGAALLYASPDLIHWEYLHPLYRRDHDATDPLWTGPMWECPQFFPLGDKYVLIVSVWDAGKTLYTVYFVGTYANHVFTPRTMRRLDVGADYYAPATLLDSQGRRLMWGWSWEARDRSTAQAVGWAGVMALPRVVTVRPDDTLGIDPAPELTALRGRHRRRVGIDLTPSSSDLLPEVHGECLEIIADFEPGARNAATFGVVARRSPDGDERTLIAYDNAAGRVFVDRAHASLDPAAQGGQHGGACTPRADGIVRLHIFLDRSIVEVYANGHTCMTERIYPTRADSRGIDLFARGGAVRVLSVDVWELKPLSVGDTAL